MIEREIKLRFDGPEAARTAVLRTGARPQHARRLQHDVLFDTVDRTLGARGCALRIRTEHDRTVLTYKGPVQPGTMKAREEHETTAADGAALVRVLDGLGLRPWFKYQKYREEFSAPGVTIAIDETPVGTYVEIEGDEQRIVDTAMALGRSEVDFVTSSYRQLFTELGSAHGLTGPDMLFPTR